VLQFNKLHDSVRKHNSWSGHEFWQRFVSNVLKIFLPHFYRFYLYHNIYYIYALDVTSHTFLCSSDSFLASFECLCGNWEVRRCGPQ